VWVGVDVLRRGGVGEWDDLPGWIPPASDGVGMHDCDVSAAVAGRPLVPGDRGDCQRHLGVDADVCRRDGAGRLRAWSTAERPDRGARAIDLVAATTAYVTADPRSAGLTLTSGLSVDSLIVIEPRGGRHASVGLDC